MRVTPRSLLWLGGRQGDLKRGYTIHWAPCQRTHHVWYWVSSPSGVCPLSPVSPFADCPLPWGEGRPKPTCKFLGVPSPSQLPLLRWTLPSPFQTPGEVAEDGKVGPQ